MPRILLCLAALVDFAIPCRADQASSAPETLIRLTVAGAGPQTGTAIPAAARLKEMNPGNPVQNYFKCFMEQQKFFFDKEAFEHREKLLAMPLAELRRRS